MVLSNKVTIKDEEVLRLKNQGVGLFIVNTTTGEVKKCIVHLLEKYQLQLNMKYL